MATACRSPGGSWEEAEAASRGTCSHADAPRRAVPRERPGIQPGTEEAQTRPGLRKRAGPLPSLTFPPVWPEVSQPTGQAPRPGSRALSLRAQPCSLPNARTTGLRPNSDVKSAPDPMGLCVICPSSLSTGQMPTVPAQRGRDHLERGCPSPGGTSIGHTVWSLPLQAHSLSPSYQVHRQRPALLRWSVSGTRQVTARDTHL